MFYNNMPQLTYFNSTDLMEVEELCPSLSEQEVLDYYALTLEDLKDADTPDLKYFYIAFKRGRTRAKKRASDKLFSAMSERQGAAAAISYLRRFGDKWPSEGDEALGDGKFSFKVVMND